MQEIPCLWIGEITGQLKTTVYSSVESRFNESPNVPLVPLVPLVRGELIHSSNLHVQQAFTFYNKKSHTHTIVQQKLRKATQYKNKTKIKNNF